MDQGTLTYVLQPTMALFPLPEQLSKNMLQSLVPILCGDKAFAYMPEQVEGWPESAEDLLRKGGIGFLDMGDRRFPAIECECQRLVRGHGMGVAVGPGGNLCNDIMELI